MTLDKRRAERIKTRLPVSVLLLHEKTETVLAGPVEGEARNFSPMGLSLSLANIMIDNYHLFFACQDTPFRILRIGFKLPENPEATIEVPARPIWYDRDNKSPGKRALRKGKRALSRAERALRKWQSRHRKPTPCSCRCACVCLSVCLSFCLFARDS